MRNAKRIPGFIPDNSIEVEYRTCECTRHWMPRKVQQRFCDVPIRHNQPAFIDDKASAKNLRESRRRSIRMIDKLDSGSDSDDRRARRVKNFGEPHDLRFSQ